MPRGYGRTGWRRGAGHRRGPGFGDGGYGPNWAVGPGYGPWYSHGYSPWYGGGSGHGPWQGYGPGYGPWQAHGPGYGVMHARGPWHDWGDEVRPYRGRRSRHYEGSDWDDERESLENEVDSLREQLHEIEDRLEEFDRSRES